MAAILALVFAVLDKPGDPGNEPVYEWRGVNHLAFRPGTSLIATARDSGVVELWDMQTRAWFKLEGHRKPVQTVTFSGDGNVLASLATDNSIRIWDVSRCRTTKAIPKSETGISSIVLNPDGTLLASCGFGTAITLWDVSSGKVKTTLNGHTDGKLTLFQKTVNSLAFSGDGRLLASGGADGRVKLWDIERATVKATIVASDEPISCVAFSPDGKLIASSSAFDAWDERGPQPIKLWDVATGKLKASFKGHRYSVSSIAFSPNGKLLASVSGDGFGDKEWEEPPEPQFEIKLWDVATQQEKAAVSGDSGQIFSVAFSPDGKMLATSNCTSLEFDNAPNNVRLWDVRALLNRTE